MEFLVVFLVCTFSGFLTGLLGIGGGLVIVPAFISILPVFGITFSLIHIVAISATCVFINSLMSCFYRRHEKYIDKKILINLAIWIMIGTISGSYLSTFAPDKLIFLIYIFVCSISLYVMNNKIYIEIKNSRLRFLLYLIFAFIGAISSSIGIGGAVLFATALKCFLDMDTKELLPTITFLVLIHSFFAFSSKFLLHEVILWIIPIAFLSSIFGTKLGIIFSKKLSDKTLNILMSMVLIIGIIKIGGEFFS